MKRFIALFTIVTLLLTTAVACSKKKTEDPGTTPSPDGEFSISEESTVISYGGTYVRDNIQLLFGISEGSWTVFGYLPSADGSTIIKGAITPKELPAFSFKEGNNELTFTFGEDSVKVDVNSGTKYSGFAGNYTRDTENILGVPDVAEPEMSASLEQLGRIALAYFIVSAKDLPEFTLDISASSFQATYMQDFLLAYSDLFFAAEAEFEPDIFANCLCYAYTADELDSLLRNASLGKFTLKGLMEANNVIKVQDDKYYVPCYGTYAGGLSALDSTDAVVGTVKVMGNVAALDGKLASVEMTLTTVESTDANTEDIIIKSVQFQTK